VLLEFGEPTFGFLPLLTLAGAQGSESFGSIETFDTKKLTMALKRIAIDHLYIPNTRCDDGVENGPAAPACTKA
jgi:hypothetical protein